MVRTGRWRYALPRRNRRPSRPPPRFACCGSLQDGHFERVGGQESIQVDVRIVAATHRDLARMVADSTFREDLWYRIAVFPVYLPPLRERPEDIPALAVHFAEKAAVRFGLPMVEPSESDVRALQSYQWPGNVRELGTVLDRAALLGNGRFLDIPAALGVSVSNGPPSSPRKPTVATGPDASSTLEAKPDEIAPLDTVIRRHIERALAATGGRIEGPGGAAELLDINPHTLRSRMRKMGIDWKVFRGKRGRRQKAEGRSDWVWLPRLLIPQPLDRCLLISAVGGFVASAMGEVVRRPSWGRVVEASHTGHFEIAVRGVLGNPVPGVFEPRVPLALIESGEPVDFVITPDPAGADCLPAAAAAPPVVEFDQVRKMLALQPAGAIPPLLRP